MDEMIVRAASESDLVQLTDIYNYYVRTSPATFDIEPVSLSNRREWFGITTKRGRIACWWQPVGMRCWVMPLAVRSALSRRMKHQWKPASIYIPIIAGRVSVSRFIPNCSGYWPERICIAP